MVFINIFDIQKEGYGRELLRRRARRCMDFSYGLQDGEEWRIYLKPFSCGPPTRNTYTDGHTQYDSDRRFARRYISIQIQKRAKQLVRPQDFPLRLIINVFGLKLKLLP